MLSEQAKDALERWHENMHIINAASVREEVKQQCLDAYTLADELLRLYPPGWDDDVTPENLEKCGFDCSNRNDERVHCRLEHGEATALCSVYFRRGQIPQSIYWKTCSTQDKSFDEMSDWMQPRNMLDVWRLMQRLKIPSPLDGRK